MPVTTFKRDGETRGPLSGPPSCVNRTNMYPVKGRSAEEVLSEVLLPRCAKLERGCIMADQAPAGGARVSVNAEQKTVQVQFVIDDLIRQLAQQGVAVAACNGCNHCKAEAD
jgi:hypothetical protein